MSSIWSVKIRSLIISLITCLEFLHLCKSQIQHYKRSGHTDGASNNNHRVSLFTNSSVIPSTLTLSALIPSWIQEYLTYSNLVSLSFVKILMDTHSYSFPFSKPTLSMDKLLQIAHVSNVTVFWRQLFQY